MKIVQSHNSVPIRLTEERWQHIVRRHPEMATSQESILETISQPAQIQEGDYGTRMAIRFYAKTPLTSKLSRSATGRWFCFNRLLGQSSIE